MSGKKLVAVLGATGRQGGSVARYFLRYPERYAVRALTRDASKPAAQKLASQGAELATADMYDQASLEKAFQGANIIFVLTDFFATHVVEEEKRAGIAAINAVIGVDSPALEVVFFSTLPEIRDQPVPYSGVVHFNGKNDLLAHIKTTSIWKKTIPVQVAVYMEDYFVFSREYAPHKQEDGTYLMSNPTRPDTKMGVASVDDLGALVYKLAQNPSEYFGRRVSLVTYYMSGPEMVKIWGEHLGVNAIFKELSYEGYLAKLHKLGWPGPAAVSDAEMFLAFRDNPDLWRSDNAVDGGALIGDEATDWKTYTESVDWSFLLK